jgi:hypothetical protein
VGEVGFDDSVVAEVCGALDVDVEGLGEVGFNDSVVAEVCGVPDVNVEGLGEGSSWVEDVANDILNNRPGKFQFQRAPRYR